MGKTESKELLSRAEQLADWVERDVVLCIQHNVQAIREKDSAYVTCLMQIPWNEEDLPWNSGRA
jgi:hypothetical protein